MQRSFQFSMRSTFIYQALKDDTHPPNLLLKNLTILTAQASEKQRASIKSLLDYFFSTIHPRLKKNGHDTGIGKQGLNYSLALDALSLEKCRINQLHLNNYDSLLFYLL